MKLKQLSATSAVLLSTIVSAQQLEPNVIKESRVELNNESARTQAPVQANRMVIIDPETGQLRPAPPQSEIPVVTNNQGLQPGVSGRASKPQRQADGSLKIELNGQFIRPLNAVIDENGNVEVGHHAHSEKAGK